MGSSKIVLTKPEKREKKGLKFDIIKADMNTALEFINSPSSAAGPER